ncbi:MAG: hypothetical protein CM1200mP30_27220 [Pseudomonadota bacterium]|nr:MAG: hypothetical protein CM1200mP30_27220 [Pseudomonadota bacterium]
MPFSNKNYWLWWLRKKNAILRLNYRTEEGIKFYDQSLKLYENLSGELNYNLMFSQQGHFTLGHSTAAVSGLVTRAENNKALGINSYILEPKEIKEMLPEIDISNHPRFPVMGHFIILQAELFVMTP